MSIGYDSVSWEAIPQHAEFVLGYDDDGDYSWPQEAWDYFTGTKYRIDSTGARADQCGFLDVETGAAHIGIARQWCESRIKLYGPRARRVLYCNMSTWPALEDAVRGVSGVKYWIANPTGHAHRIPGAVMTQYAWPGYGSPGNYDMDYLYGKLG